MPRPVLEKMRFRLMLLPVAAALKSFTPTPARPLKATMFAAAGVSPPI